MIFIPIRIIAFIFAAHFKTFIKKMEKKIVLLTGSSAGIGKAAAELLVNAGVIVYGASRSGGEAYENKTTGGKYIPVKMDVTIETDINSTVERIIADCGKLDAVIANAGNGIAGSVEDTTIEEVKFQFETNYFGVVKTINACLPVFRAQGFGKIITVSSLAGIIPIPFQTFYSSVKAAINMYMNGLSMEVKPFGIQCSLILPGDTKTDFTKNRIFTKAAQNEKSVYHKTMKLSVARMEKDEQNGMSPYSVAKPIVKQVLNKKMHSFYVTGVLNQLFYHLFKIFPIDFRLWIISKLYA